MVTTEEKSGLRLLYERYDIPKQGVDRVNGVIRGVKVIGRYSPNRHNVDGVEKTEYSLDALKAAVPLYEGIQVCKKHPPRKDASDERTEDEVIGWLEAVRADDDGLYADLHLLISDPGAQKLLEAAEKNPRLFALSHNALGRGDVHNRTYVIKEIARVNSVDLTTRPGTVKSLFESLEPNPMTTSTLKQIVESHKTEAGKPKLRRLLEEMGSAYEAMQMDDAGPDADFETHLFNAFKACKAKDPKLANKILSMLKAASSSGDDEEETPVSEKKEDKKDDEKRAMESREVEQMRSELKELRENRQKTELKEYCREECGKRELTCDTVLLEGLVLMADKPAIGKHLDYLKGLGLRSLSGDAPKSQAPSGSNKLLESKVKLPEKREELLAYLRN